MNKKNFLIPNITIFLITSTIILLIPIKIQNKTGFIITFLYYLIFNILSSFTICKNTNSIIKQDILNLSIIYLYIILDIVTIIILLLSKIIFINTNIIVILNFILLLISLIIFFFMIKANKFIIAKNENIEVKTQVVNNWKIRIELLFNNNTNQDITDNLKNLYENLKYIDPIENEITKELDKNIERLIKELEINLNSNSINKIIKLLNERKVLINNNK